MWWHPPKIMVMQNVNIDCCFNPHDTKFGLCTKLKFIKYEKVMCCLCYAMAETRKKKLTKYGMSLCGLLLRNWNKEDQCEFVCWMVIGKYSSRNDSHVHPLKPSLAWAWCRAKECHLRWIPWFQNFNIPAPVQI
jgi:hypothetical protein